MTIIHYKLFQFLGLGYIYFYKFDVGRQLLNMRFPAMSLLNLNKIASKYFDLFLYMLIVPLVFKPISSNSYRSFAATHNNIAAGVSLPNRSTNFSYDNIELRSVASKIALKLREISNTVLGVPIIQDIYDSLEYEDIVPDPMKQVKRVSEKLANKIDDFLNALNRTVEAVEVFGRLRIKDFTVAKPCIYVSGDLNTSGLNNAMPDSFQIPQSQSLLDLTKVFLFNNNANPLVKMQYFIANMDTDQTTHLYNGDEHDACRRIVDDPVVQALYLKTVSRDAKHIVLLIDHGSSLSINQLNTAKALAKHIVLSLSHDDRISLFGLAEILTSPLAETCTEMAMPYATQSTKHQFTNFIDALSLSNESTNHSQGFQMAFSVICATVANIANTDAIIIYVSRGLLSSLEEAKIVIETIYNGQNKISQAVVINTCVLLDDGKPLIYGKHFMKDISNQDFSKYNITSNWNMSFRGYIETVNSTFDIGPVVRRLCSSKKPIPTHLRRVFSLPHWDLYKEGKLVISITQACVVGEKLLGVAGIDMYLNDLGEDVNYFNDIGTSYAFIINNQGYTVVHQSMKQNFLFEQPMEIDIQFLETAGRFEDVRDEMLRNFSGSMHISTDNLHIAAFSAGKKETIMTYFWDSVEMTPFIAVAVSKASTLQKSVPSSVEISPSADWTHHLLDHLPMGRSNYEVCRHLRQLSSFETGSLFLSAWCFQSPFKYLTSEDKASTWNDLSYMAYIKDKTKLLANPGIRPHIRSDVLMVVQLLPYWKRLFNESPFSQYIVRRYIATSSGVVVVYPGAVIDHKLDPVRRPWFVRAIESPGAVTISSPYLDFGGAGYIVTLSRAVKQGTAVSAIDVTLGYLYKLMLDNMPLCEAGDWERDRSSNASVKCFLMDDRGYLLAHPSLIDPSSKSPVEQQHITHKESLLANDILNHKGFVTKHVCTDWSSGSVDRFYIFNTNLHDVVSNIIAGPEQCVHYQLTALPNTNMLIAVVNTTCNVTAFCPCSTIDTHCFDCNRMEQNECECPCECPLKMDYCSGPPKTTFTYNQACPLPAESSHQITNAVVKALSITRPCLYHNCQQHLTHRNCLGVVGCEWCQLKSDALTPLKTPFCAHHMYCFNGVLGAATPYGDDYIRLDGYEKDWSQKSIPTGSAASAILVLFGALALMIFCYRKHNQSAQLRYEAQTCDAALSMFNLDKLSEEPPTGQHNALLHSAQEVDVALLSPISPYGMNSDYRRPPTGDSDHGYSTMTPHEELEQPDTNNTTPPLQQTLLPNPILAAVTVHMVMDTS